MGGGWYGRFAPYEAEVEDNSQPAPLVVIHSMPCFGCNWNCIYPRQRHEPVKCIRDIFFEDVWSAVEKSVLRREPGR